MTPFEHNEFDNHEAVHFFADATSGLRAVIAVHSTALGPAAGGCRRWVYCSQEDALTDALRLSRGMSFKNAIAGLPFGGGKAVILAQGEKSTQEWAAFGDAVESLEGRYVTAEDVGVSVDDMRIVRQRTAFVAGLPQNGAAAGGDPSPWTALGVFLGIQAAVSFRFGRNSLSGLRVAVQGTGNVGLHLCRLLSGTGAELIVADVNEANLERVRNEVEVHEVSAADITTSDVDVLAPCALGGSIDERTIPNIKARIIAGAANNQLATDAAGECLLEHEILYAPDYVINAGGIISVAREYLGGTSVRDVREEVARIPRRLDRIFAVARQKSLPTSQVADDMARAIIRDKQAASGITRLIA